MRKTVIVAVLGMCLLAVPASATIWLDHGGIENIDYVINDMVYVDAQNSSIPGTNLNILSGGELNCEYVWLHHNSVLNVNGGKVAGIWTFDNSTVNLYAGEIYWYMRITENATLNVYGGVIRKSFSTLSDSVQIWGGQLEGDISAHGGIIRLYGIFDQGYGVFTGEGEITGTLSNGDSISTNYSTYDSGSIILAPVPEPTITCLLAFGWLFQRRRQELNLNRVWTRGRDINS